MYLKVMTWTDAGINVHAIHGTLDDLNRLAGLIDSAIAEARPGDLIHLGHNFVPDAEYDLLLEVRDDDFDPAMADPCLA